MAVILLLYASPPRQLLVVLSLLLLSLSLSLSLLSLQPTGLLFAFRQLRLLRAVQRAAPRGGAGVHPRHPGRCRRRRNAQPARSLCFLSSVENAVCKDSHRCVNAQPTHVCFSSSLWRTLSLYGFLHHAGAARMPSPHTFCFSSLWRTLPVAPPRWSTLTISAQ